MKSILCLLSVFLLTAGCTRESNEDSAAEFSVSKQSLEFPAEGGEQTFAVTSSAPVYVTHGKSWITVTEGTKKGNVTTYRVSVSENEETSMRSATLSVASSSDRKYVDVFQAAAAPGGVNPPQPGENPALDMSARLGMGWNLGNQFDAFNNGVAGETAWGNPMATQETFNKVRAAGFTTVRIPVTWLGKYGGAPNYKISEAWLNRVAEVVGYAEKAGLNAIINMHHDGSESKYWLDIIDAAKNDAVQQQILEQVTAMWTQIAEKFKDKGYFLIFESFNEIHDGGWGWGSNRTDGGRQYKCLNEWNQAFVNAVRATGGKNADRFLGVPAYCTNTDLAISSFIMPKDTAQDRLLISVHCYDPSEYTLTARYSEWGHTASSSKKAPGDNEAELKGTFEKLYNNFVSKGIPVYLGEFGCVNREDARQQSFQQYYLRYYAKLSKIYGVPSILWDNGARGAGNEKHAFIDHATGEYCSDEAKAAVQAMLDSYKNDSTLEQVYASAPK